MIPVAVVAQQAAGNAQQPLQVTTEMVQIGVSVLASGRRFRERSASGRIFVCWMAGNDQPLVFFAPTDAPAQILVMVETSPAVYLIQSQHIAAAYALLDGLGAGRSGGAGDLRSSAARGAGFYAGQECDCWRRWDRFNFRWEWAN